VKRVAVFGNAGGGKSTLARRLAELTRLPLHVVDMMQFRVGGVAVPHDEFLEAHAELLQRDAWIIDGYGSVELAWERFSAADTLVYVDLPFFVHFLWITKRLMKGLFVTPPGWPEGSPVISSSLSSYRVLWLCHRHLTPKYRALVSEVTSTKRVHHLRSVQEMSGFLDAVRVEAKTG
jgi:adenylate kinase family enzyme